MGTIRLAAERTDSSSISDYRDQLIEGFEQIEQVLKEDIGVFAVEYEDRRRITSY
jgi:hypothetical protein